MVLPLPIMYTLRAAIIYLLSRFVCFFGFRFSFLFYYWIYKSYPPLTSPHLFFASKPFFGFLLFALRLSVFFSPPWPFVIVIVIVAIRHHHQHRIPSIHTPLSDCHAGQSVNSALYSKARVFFLPMYSSPLSFLLPFLFFSLSF